MLGTLNTFDSRDKKVTLYDKKIMKMDHSDRLGIVDPYNDDSLSMARHQKSPLSALRKNNNQLMVPGAKELAGQDNSNFRGLSINESISI